MKPKKVAPAVRANINNPTQDQIIDHILLFDPLDTTTALPSSTPQPSFLIATKAPQIAWPKNERPVPKKLKKTPDPEAPLPKADIIVVTWTVAEALALSDTLTPGFRSKTDWYNYRHNWEANFKPKVHGAAPSLKADRLGKWFLTKIAGKTVMCFKSELHMARDGAAMPVKDLWKQLIMEVQPKLVITTGTAGGIGANIQLGDVIVSKKIRFDCNRTFKNSPFRDEEFTCTKAIPTGHVAKANSTLMHYTTDMLPKAKRKAKIIINPLKGITPIDVVTTDFFAFDDDVNDYKLQGLGSLVEMGDATLGLACKELGGSAPAWIAVRNASDPQITGGKTLKESADIAGRIYEKYGYWTTVNSAIACWALILSHK